MAFTTTYPWTSKYSNLVSMERNLLVVLNCDLLINLCCRLRLVMPPALGFALAYPLMCLAHVLFPAVAAYAIVGGAVLGYIGYDCTHYYLHHAKVLEFHFKEMKKYHLAHHYKNYESGYGITSKIWDYVFGTKLNY